LERAAELFRRGATEAREARLKVHDLERLELLFNGEHLNRPRSAEGLLRVLIAAAPADLGPMFRLARFQVAQGWFDQAEIDAAGSAPTQ
jgi:hypothetical protein